MKDLAFLGCGHIHTPGFINMLKPRKDVRVTKVWDHHAARGTQRAGELNAAFVGEVADILSDSSIAGVVVASETDLHDGLVAKVAAAKKHLFVEKPLGMRADDAYRMASAIERAGVLFQTGYFMRGISNVRAIKKLVDEKWFGTITRVRASNCHSGALGGWFDSKPNDPASDWRWMADVKRSGVGAFGDLGTHSLDLLLWMFGSVQSVTATLDLGTKRYEGTDETGEALFVFESGIIATLAAAWDDIANPVSFLVSGTKGHAMIVDGKLHLQHADKQIAAVMSDAMPGLPHAFELFLDAVAGKPDVQLVGAKEAAYRSAVMEAMYEAARTKSWVTPKAL
jgi:predicted dehydrogenase